MKKIQISPSILSADFSQLGKEIKKLEDAGADKIINYKNEDVIAEILKFTKDEGVDRVMEVEFGGNLPINEKILKTNGVIAAYGSMAEMQPRLPFYNLMFKGVKIDTYLIYSINANLRKKIVEGLSNYLNNDSLKHMISKSYSMDEIVEAHKTMEGGSLIGNIIINI